MAASATVAITSASSSSKTARNSASLSAKWWYSAPRVTPARSTMASRPVAAYPSRANSSRAACTRARAGGGGPLRLAPALAFGMFAA